MTAQTNTDLSDGVSAAVQRAQAHLVGRQDAAGWWKGELRTNVTMDAEDLLLRQFLGILKADELEQAARWIRSQQRPDGTWATSKAVPAICRPRSRPTPRCAWPATASTTPHMVRAREFVLAGGGIEASRVFTRIWLALFGEWSWDDLPSMPPELILLPTWFPLNIYDWGCWARQTVVADHRRGDAATGPSAAVRPRRTADGRAMPPPGKTGAVAAAFTVLDKVLKPYDRSPVNPGRDDALKQAAEWILARQEADGGWGGIQPPWVYSILALHLTRPSARRSGGGRRDQGPGRFPGPRADRRRRRPPARGVPVAGVGHLPGRHRVARFRRRPRRPGDTTAVDWLLRRRGHGSRATGRLRRPDLDAAGWAFEFANDLYPDIDDTAEVVLALRRIGLESSARRRGGSRSGNPVGGRHAVPRRRLGRVRRRQHAPARREGAVLRLRRGDRSAVGRRDGACRRDAGASARFGPDPSPAPGAVCDGCSTPRRPTARAVRTMGHSNYVYGTGAVVPALIAAGVAADSTDPARGAVRWLEAASEPRRRVGVGTALLRRRRVARSW